MPVISASAFGAIVGVCTTCFKNGLCGLQFYRKPWEHVIAGTAGAYLFVWIAEKEDEMIAKIEKYYSDLENAKAQE